MQAMQRMEDENISQNGSMMCVAPPTITDGKPPFNEIMTAKKKRAKFGLLKLAVRLFQPTSKTDQKQVKIVTMKQPKESTKPAKWEKIVGSMRPLHLQENISSPTRSVATITPDASPRKGDGTLSEDNFICSSVASSPSPSLSSRKSAIGTMTQYNSAVNLQALDSPMSQYNSAVNLQALDSPMSQYCSTNNLQGLVEEEEKDPDEVFESITGDDMIDSKADEFIAHFYQVMRLERSNRTDIGGRWMV